MSSMSDVSSHLQTLIGNAPNEELGNLFRELDELYSKRLWHQLTGVLMTLVHRPELQSGDQLSQFYRQVIADFDSK